MLNRLASLASLASIACAITFVACGDTHSYRNASQIDAVAADSVATGEDGVSDDIDANTDDAPLDTVLQTIQRHNNKYPVVLVHGMAGFQPILRFVDYFYRVKKVMTAEGYAVYAPHVDPFQTIAYRTSQLRCQIDDILATTGAAKIHIIAHSQGGLDARYLISTLGYGDRVATLMTIGTPHHGVRLIDMALGYIPSGATRGIATLTNILSNVLLGGHADLMAQLHDLSQRYVDGTFNAENPDDPRVEYFSYAGQTQANILANLTKVDLVNPMLLATYTLARRTEGDNDGLVSVESARWGTFLGTVPADHWDEIGQLPGAPHLAFRHLRFYSGMAKFLANTDDAPIF